MISVKNCWIVKAVELLITRIKKRISTTDYNLEIIDTVNRSKITAFDVSISRYMLILSNKSLLWWLCVTIVIFSSVQFHYCCCSCLFILVGLLVSVTVDDHTWHLYFQPNSSVLLLNSIERAHKKQANSSQPLWQQLQFNFSCERSHTAWNNLPEKHSIEQNGFGSDKLVDCLHCPIQIHCPKIITSNSNNLGSILFTMNLGTGRIHSWNWNCLWIFSCHYLK